MGKKSCLNSKTIYKIHSLSKIPYVGEDDLLEMEILHPLAALLFKQTCNVLLDIYIYIFLENILIVPISLSLGEKRI